MIVRAVAPPPPRKPFRGIKPYRYLDRGIFFARTAESFKLLRLVTLYRGVLLYGDSGCGKSSLINAGFIPLALREDFAPHHLRLHPEYRGQEFVVERILEDSASDSPFLPSIFGGGEGGQTLGLSASDLKRKLMPFRTMDLSERVASSLRPPANQLSRYIAGRLDPATIELLGADDALQRPSPELKQSISELLRRLLADPDLCAAQNITGLRLSRQTRRLIGKAQRTDRTERFLNYCAALNQRLLEEAFPQPQPPLPQIPLLIFDQFEELITLFEIEPKGKRLRELLEVQGAIIGTLAELIYDEALTIKILLVFREDYLAKLDKLFRLCPDLPDRYLRLTPPDPEKLHDIIRGPFQNFPPGTFGREIPESLAERLANAIKEKYEGGPVNLTEVQIICQRLWESPDPEALFARKETEGSGVQGLLEDYLEESIGHLDEPSRPLALAVLGRLITSSPAPTRNIVGHYDLISSVMQSEGKGEQDVRAAVKELHRSRLISSEYRHNVDFYAITSEFLVPWIVKKKAEQLAELAKVAQREKEKALEEARLSSTRRIALAALNGIEVDPERSLLLAVEAAERARAVKTQRIIEVEDALHRSLHVSRARQTLSNPHTGPVNSVAFGNDRTLASAGADGRIFLWDLAPPGQAHLLGTHDLPINKIAFSPDGRRLASAASDGRIKLWDVDHQALSVETPAWSGCLNNLDFSPDGSLLATAGSDGNAKLWSGSSLEYIRTLGLLDTSYRALNGIVFIPGTRTIATADQAGRIAILDLSSGDLIRSAESYHMLSALAVDRDGKRLASGSSDSSVEVWNVSSLERCSRFPNDEGGIGGIAFSPINDHLAISYVNRTVKLWDLQSQREHLCLVGHRGSVNGIAFSPEGRFLATASADETVKVWEVDSFDDELWTKQFPSFTNRAVFFADDPLVALAMSDGVSEIWNPRARRRTMVLRGHSGPINSVAVNADGSWAVTGSADRQVRVWDTATGHDRLGRPLGGHDGPVNSVAISSDGKYVASGGADHTVRIWSVSDGRQHELYWHSDIVNCVAFHPREAIVGLAGSDGLARLWDIDRGDRGFKFSHAPYALREATFSPDGDVFATAGVFVRLWDASTGELIRTLEGPIGSILGVVFSPDGKRIVTAGSDKTCRIWDSRSGDELMVLVGHTAPVRSVATSKSGRYLLSADMDRTVRVWILGGDELLELARRRISRPFTNFERRKFLSDAPTDAGAAG